MFVGSEGFHCGRPLPLCVHSSRLDPVGPWTDSIPPSPGYKQWSKCTLLSGILDSQLHEVFDNSYVAIYFPKLMDIPLFQ